MKILVTRKIPGNHLDKLKEKGFDVLVSEFDRPLSPEELVEKIAGVDGVLSLLTDKIDGDVMDASGPSLKIISNYAVGFDNVDVEEASKRGILVTNTPSEEVNESVADHTWALILALSRRIVEADKAVKGGAYSGWEPEIFLGDNLSGKVLGIVGLGRIGSLVAKRAKGFDMNVYYNKHSPDPEAEKEYGVAFAELDELLHKCDIVSIHVPLTKETRHMFNEQIFSKMKKGSILVNTARGPIVDEHALSNALSTGQLKGAGLDVFDNEPNINPELVGMENVILTPHIASATKDARNKMGEQAVGALIDVFSDKMPMNLVDDKVWPNRRK